MLDTLGTEEGPGNVQLFGTDDNDTLAIEDLLGDNGGQTTQKVTLTVNNNNLDRRKKDGLGDGRKDGEPVGCTFSKDIWS